MNSLLIRKSKDPTKRTSYAIFFMVDGDTIGHHTSENGSFVEIGRIIDGWCNHNMVPRDMVKTELKPEKQTQLHPAKDVVGG